MTRRWCERASPRYSPPSRACWWWARPRTAPTRSARRGTCDPDVVLMDVRMPVMDGLQATRQILGTAAGPQRPRVLMLTTFDLDDYVYEALRAGASGFLLKDATAAELVHAVRVVAAGDALLAPVGDPAAHRRLRPPATPGPAAPRPRLGALTHRESEVLRLIAARPVQRRDQRHPGHRRADDQDLRRPHPGQAGPPRPRPGRRLRLRNRPRHAGRTWSGANKAGRRAGTLSERAVRQLDELQIGRDARHAGSGACTDGSGWLR